jgi:hypothetical protein
VKTAVQWRIQSRYDYRQAAELRSAWTGEGARPHTGNYYCPVNNFKFSAFQRIAA